MERVYSATDMRGRVLDPGDRVIGQDGKTFATIYSIPNSNTIWVYTEKGYYKMWNSKNILKARS